MEQPDHTSLEHIHDPGSPRRKYTLRFLTYPDFLSQRKNSSCDHIFGHPSQFDVGSGRTSQVFQTKKRLQNKVTS